MRTVEDPQKWTARSQTIHTGLECEGQGRPFQANLERQLFLATVQHTNEVYKPTLDLQPFQGVLSNFTRYPKKILEEIVAECYDLIVLGTWVNTVNCR